MKGKKRIKFLQQNEEIKEEKRVKEGGKVRKEWDGRLRKMKKKITNGQGEEKKQKAKLLHAIRVYIL